MRGTLLDIVGPLCFHRIIPAHAGNSLPSVPAFGSHADHPRACGELPVTLNADPENGGSSPRMRGTLILQLLYKCCYRIIPAHAGNSRIPSRWFTRTADHPRACGELLRPGMAPGWLAGSSPRMRGTPLATREQGSRLRIIPAHAGNSSSRILRMSVSSDHPRACGELPYRVGERGEEIGSSPRMRGTRGEHHPVLVLDRIIPAHAGNSYPTLVFLSRRSDHPRACGELRYLAASASALAGSSPRMRGTPGPELPQDLVGRIIPAHAGNSLPVMALSPVLPDHPRACGELARRCGRSSGRNGSSPRMRGTPFRS